MPKKVSSGLQAFVLQIPPLIGTHFAYYRIYFPSPLWLTVQDPDSLRCVQLPQFHIQSKALGFRHLESLFLNLLIGHEYNSCFE